MLGHGNYLLPEKLAKKCNLFVMDGVSIFFVLSGFLIGGILIKILEKEKCTFSNLYNFWTRRWLRTLPNYFFILILLLLLSLLFSNDFNLWNKKIYFLFLQNFNSPHPIFFSEAWSLSVEEWFYLLVPSILFLCIGLFQFPSRKIIIFTALVILTLSTGFRYYRFSALTGFTVDIWDSTFRKQVITRLDSLMFGLIGAYIYYYFKEFWTKYKTLFFIIGITILVLTQTRLIHRHLGDYLHLYLYVFSFSITSLGTLFLLPFLSEYKKGKGLVYNAITYISLTSYSMYLLNYSVIQFWALRYVNWLGLTEAPFIIIRYLSFWVFTVVGAILLYKYLELPFMKLRDRNKEITAQLSS